MTAQSANESKSPPHECVAGNLAHCLALYSWWLAHIGATVLHGDSPKLSRARVSDQQFYLEIDVSQQSQVSFSTHTAIALANELVVKAT